MGARIQQVCAWLGLPLRMFLVMDASAACRAVSRDGVGRMRHMEVKTLWIQQLVKSGALLIGRVDGEENTSDIGTKPLPAARFAQLRAAIGIQLVSVALAQHCEQQGPDDEMLEVIMLDAKLSGFMIGVLLTAIVSLIIGMCVVAFLFTSQRPAVARCTRCAHTQTELTRASTVLTQSQAPLEVLASGGFAHCSEKSSTARGSSRADVSPVDCRLSIGGISQPEHAPPEAACSRSCNCVAVDCS